MLPTYASMQTSICKSKPLLIAHWKSRSTLATKLKFCYEENHVNLKYHKHGQFRHGLACTDSHELSKVFSEPKLSHVF